MSSPIKNVNLIKDLILFLPESPWPTTVPTTLQVLSVFSTNEWVSDMWKKIPTDLATRTMSLFYIYLRLKHEVYNETETAG